MHMWLYTHNYTHNSSIFDQGYYLTNIDQSFSRCLSNWAKKYLIKDENINKSESETVGQTKINNHRVLELNNQNRNV